MRKKSDVYLDGERQQDHFLSQSSYRCHARCCDGVQT
jgi:hypothetical protein